MNEEEIIAKLEETRQNTRKLENQLKELRKTDYAKEILALKGKCFANKSLDGDKWDTVYKIIDCFPDETLSKLKVIVVRSYSEDAYSIQETSYPGDWFEDDDYEEISNEHFLYIYTIVLQKINALEV